VGYWKNARLFSRCDDRGVITELERASEGENSSPMSDSREFPANSKKGAWWAKKESLESFSRRIKGPTNKGKGKEGEGREKVREELKKKRVGK